MRSFILGIILISSIPANAESWLRVGNSGQNNVEIQTDTLNSNEPIIVEQKRFYVEGLNSTRTNTIVRQGDRILAIIKPLASQTNISNIENESALTK